ncbi:unnamed protein product [Schistosoma mattheei]|uniref:long-chain-fatty-acid--CoA ligase n=2 Tax=Schistosoma mattheei TaxID=31246 RepID=A0AA85BRM9_9TREM|nr:unnamed protein product [Schistosoma mattheei]
MFQELGMNKLLPKKDPLPSDLYMVCYTSGSTGLPKGVMVNHEQIVDAVFSILEASENKVNVTIYASLEFKSEHVSHKFSNPYIAHQIQFKSSFISPIGAYDGTNTSSYYIMMGARLGFLTDSIDNLVVDAQALKPGVITAVPRVLSSIYTKYQKSLDDSKIKRQLYNRIVKIKMVEQKRGKFYHNSILDTLCFKKLRKLLGGRVYCVVSGGAPLPTEISKFVHAAFGLLAEGYGSTETMGSITITLVGEYRLGTVGSVAHGVEVKLVDVKDLGLDALRDQRGEICVKGKRCTKGYYKEPEKSAELIDNEGWLHTGDIGEWTLEGSLKIVDRLKSIFKLAQGEYVAPEKVETVYKCCKLVSQIFVDGNSKQNYPVAIVVPDFTELRSCLNNAGVLHCSKLSDHELSQNKVVNKFVLERMNAVADENMLKSFEKVQAIYLTDQAFNADNGLLTPTMKLARIKARSYFSKIIDSLYPQS